MPQEQPEQDHNWTIICPGPSVMDYVRRAGLNSHTDFQPRGTLVAVNSAILCPLPFDYWAVGDIELFVQMMAAGKPLGAQAEKLVTLFVPQRWGNDMRERYPEMMPVFERFIACFYPCANWDDLARSMPFGQELEWRSFTLLTALALAVKYGAGNIEVHGADFAGDRYFVPGVENERTNLSPDRWRCEKELFEAIVAESAKHGINIERVRT